jgi:hypothetical protein
METGCDEVIENMQTCLFECTSNTKTFFSKKSADLEKCENLIVYEKLLGEVTDIQIVYDIDKIDADKIYQIIYDTESKSLSITK